MDERHLDFHIKMVRNNVQALIKEFNFSLTDFANFTKIHTSTICKYNKNLLHVSLMNLLRISSAFGISPERLISIDGSIYDVIDKIKKNKNMMLMIHEVKCTATQGNKNGNSS